MVFSMYKRQECSQQGWGQIGQLLAGYYKATGKDREIY